MTTFHDVVNTFNTGTSFFQVSPSTSHQIEDQRTHITAAACGSDHTILLDTHGRVYACGENDKGQLGLGHNTMKNTFIRVPTPDNITVKQMACGDEHTVLVDTRGKVYTCGDNGDGQLGLGHNTMKNTFTQVTSLDDVEIEHVVCGGAHTFLFDKEGKAYGCGRNQEGQLALSNMKDQNTFTRVQTFDGKKQLFCNYHATMLIKSEEENQPNIEKGNAARMMERAVELDGIKLQHGSCGDDHIMVLDESGRVHARGGNIEGQLGLGHKKDQQHFQLVEMPDNKNIKQVACGDDYTLLLCTDNSLYACGANYDNQLPCLVPNKNSQQGQDSSSFTTFQRVSLPQALATATIQRVICGATHNLLLANNGIVYSCGLNTKGQLGLGHNDHQDMFTPVQIVSNERVLAELADDMPEDEKLEPTLRKQRMR